MIKRNIVSSLKFAKSFVTFSVMEEINNSFVEIFYKVSLTSKISFFLDNCLQEVENKIGGRITNIVVIIDENKKLNYKIDKKIKRIFIPHGTITSKDIENVISLIKLENKNPGEKIIHVQPNKFIVQKNNEQKIYLQAPLGKMGNQLEITTYITKIDVSVFDYIEQIVKSKNLILSQILLSSQETCQRTLSNSILEQKVVSIQLLDNKVVTSISENFCLKKNFIIYDFGFNNLVEFVSKKFNCEKGEALKLINVHANVDLSKKTNIFYDSLSNRHFTNIYLTKVLKSFCQKIIIAIKKFLQQENAWKVPIVLIGKGNKIENIDNILKRQFEFENIFLYSPLSFIEKKYENFCPIGVYHFFQAMDKIYSRQYDTIIETRPERISQVLKMKKQKKWYSKVLEILGGKNVWK